MTTEHRDEEAIFKAAFKLKSPTQQAAYLKRACGHDADLLARVEALLKAHEEAGSFLEAPAVGPNATSDDSPLIDGPGTKIGRYELLELIGEGGMGLVYMAQQKKPVKRRVALKIIKPGMDSKQIIARFEAERQTLAVLDHPNIAHVFDAGTTKTGRPYFIMEYVKGMSITRYCDEKKLDIEKRLRLFEQVCEGIHHAHQKGIIHRDLKPSNILVSVHGDRAVPKIIDFGIAKAVTQPLTEKTVVTFQGQLMGTPEYMSPEQVDLAMQDIDTRSDIYSLGVVLYELLAGVLPFERESLAGLGFAEIQRTIREQEPASPSIRLTSLGEEAKTIAASRDTHVVALARRLHRELEWIPLKAMRKDRCRRYRSASEVADDVRNYLNGLPLIAGPETAMYRAKKFVHKHAGSVATVALVAAAIVLGLIVSTTMYVRAEKMRELAVKAEKVAEERSEDYRRSLYRNHVASANIAYHDGNMHRLRELLELCPEDLRGWEWYRLNHISDQPCMIIRGDAGPVYSVEFSPDGKRIVTAWDKTIKVWDVATGAEVMNLHEHEASVISTMFSSDGKRIVSSGNDKMVKIWDAVTGMTLLEHEGSEGARFSPDGKRIVSGGDDDTIRVWDATSGTELMTIRGHSGPIWAVRFSPDGRRIISSSKDGTLKVWDATVGMELMTLRGHDGVIPVVFSPDGKWICSGSADGTIKVWDAACGTEVMTLRGHEGMIVTVAFSPDGKQIITGGVDRSIKLWDAANGNELMTLHGHQGLVLSVSFSPDGQRIASSSMDGTVRVWDATVKHDQMILHGSHHSVFSPDNKRLISAGKDDNTVKVFDVATGTELMTLCGHNGRVWSVAFSPDGKRIVSGSFDQTVRVWDTVTGDSLMILRGHSDRIWSVAYSPDGNRIISGSYDGTIRVWDADKGTEIKSLIGHNARIEAVAYSPDGERIASGSWDNTVKVWDAETGDELMTLIGHKNGISDVAFSPDCARIISGSSDNTVKVWDAETGDEMMTINGHKGRVRSVTVSPDGERIVSSCGDSIGDSSENSTMKIWDAATGAELMTLRSNNIRSIAFSPDGNTIAIDSHNGTTLLESKVPAGGYDPRRTTITARKVVDKLHKEHGLYSKVIEKLKADDKLEESVCKVALQIANARLWEDAEKLKKVEK